MLAETSSPTVRPAALASAAAVEKCDTTLSIYVQEDIRGIIDFECLKSKVKVFAMDMSAENPSLISAFNFLQRILCESIERL